MPLQQRLPIVAIGASAGGLEALALFLSHVPINSGLAFIVIQHLDPDHKGMMPELLQRSTLMPVSQAKSQMAVKPDCVYVIPPNSDLSIRHDRLYLLEPVAARGLRLPIDFFFHALAVDHGTLAVGVILSGMGSDGTLGARAIKENGGLMLAQTPATAKFDSMPTSLINAGLADIIAPAEALPQRIITTLNRQRPPQIVAAEAEADAAAHLSAFNKICILLRQRTGQDFSLYKKSTLYRRIERRIAVHQLKRIDDYVRYLQENPEELDLLFKELLIGVTHFFRDPATWAYLQDQVLPEMLANSPADSALRAWVAGCSSGEEAYSLAISFREWQENQNPPTRHSLQIFATDLDPDAIEKARRAVYPANIAIDVSAERLQRFFVEEGNGFRVAKKIRDMVVFAPQNLIMDPPFTKLDILTCRNLLIYFGPDLQKKLLPLFHYSLKPGGILMLGSAESITGFNDLFETLESKARLFRRNRSIAPTSEVEFPSRHLPPPTESFMDTTPKSAQPNLQNLADQLLLQHFAPAAVLVTASGDLVYINGRTGKYLEPAAGKVNWNIYAMAREGLRQEISLAMPQALRSGETVICRNLQVGTNDGMQTIDLTVYPIKEPGLLNGMAMLVLTDVPAVADLDPSLTETSKKAPSRAKREQELATALTQAKQEIKRLHEEMQTSQEEVKSASEELQSTNEELQSTNEELTTSKEEMQSLNEELQTVNIELQTKVDALSSANNDMKNLLNSTDIATVFLDNALCVRRFTTHATRLFKLIPSDIGRPLSDIVSSLNYTELPIDAEAVLNTLAFSDREVATGDGRWFQVKVKIMPYRTLDNVIDGVVMTFNDISRAKILEAELRAIGKAP